MSASAAMITRPRDDETQGRANIGGGVELAYIDRGHGQPIVFIPAWTFTKEVFAKQISYFEKNFRVIAYDPRSQGASTSTIEGNDYVTHAQDLAALLRVLRIENPIIVAWSAGALAAWGMTKIKGAQSIAAMVAIDQPPKGMSMDPSDWTEGSLEELAGTHTLFLRDRAGQAHYVRRNISNTFIERMTDPDEEEWLVAQSLTTNPLVAAQLYASCMFTDLHVAAVNLSRVRPNLFFIAQHWADKATRYVRNKMPSVQTAVFGGHMMFWEYPDAFNQVLDEFIKAFVMGKTVKL
jgi:pimeloyl-ACP methyl ester carboxylesterase